MKIPQDSIDRVRDSADIVDVISQFVDLKQRGSNYFGLCPFHGEKTASFSVAPSKQIYHCFGCGAGGNVFSFVMEYQKVPFPESIKILAERYNIPIQIKESKGSNELFFLVKDSNIPAVIAEAKIEDPPYDKKGNVIPFAGIRSVLLAICIRD